MTLKAICLTILISISLFARADVLDEFEYALIDGNYAKAREHLSKMNATPSDMRGYEELVRVLEACEQFISLADQHMIMPSSTPIATLEAAYDAIGFHESYFAVSDAIIDLINERLQRANQMMEFAHKALSPDTIEKEAAEREARAAEEQALRTACGLDYHQLKLGMTLDQVKLCVGTPYLESVYFQRGLLTSTYRINQYYVQVMGYRVIGWAK